VISLNFQESFDPHTATTASTSSYGYFYQNLVRANPRTYEIEPELAQRWETPSPTGIIFTLAPTITWHNRAPANGRPLKVEDVVFSHNRARTDDHSPGSTRWKRWCAGGIRTAGY
jgi:peptide/nickel transport system substrate-binding protein